MKIAELKQKSKEELAVLLREKKARVDELKYLLRQRKVKNVREVGDVKKDIARILTLMKN